MQPKYAIHISRFRASNHRLPVVAGRFIGRPRSERLCDLCNLDDLGDEYHYLMKCPFFHTHHVTFLKDEHIQQCNMLDMKHNINSENIEELKNLLKFVSIIMKYFSKESKSEKDEHKQRKGDSSVQVNELPKCRYNYSYYTIYYRLHIDLI